jgi:hypothetical protein
MAEPTVVEVGVLAADNDPITVAIPASRQLNDILVLVIETANQDIATPAGWTELSSSPQGTGTSGSAASSMLLAFWKRSDGTETTVAPADSGDHQLGFVVVLRNALLSGDPIDVTAGDVLAVADTVVTIPGGTTTVADCLILACATHMTDTSSAQFSAWANASLTDVTEIADKSSTQGTGGGGIGIATGVKEVAGVFSATTATAANSTAQARISMAIKPEPPPVFTERRGMISWIELSVPEA